MTKWRRQICSRFQGLKEGLKNSIPNLGYLAHLLINLAVKARAEKKRGIPKDIPNDADT